VTYDREISHALKVDSVCGLPRLIRNTKEMKPVIKGSPVWSVREFVCEDSLSWDERQFLWRQCIAYVFRAVAALHQCAPGQMTWLEEPPPWLRPGYCFASVIV